MDAKGLIGGRLDFERPNPTSTARCRVCMVCAIFVLYCQAAMVSIPGVAVFICALQMMLLPLCSYKQTKSDP